MQNFLIRILLCILWLLSKTPMYITEKFGRFLGVIGFYCAKNRRNIGLKNLALCFPQMSEKERIDIIKQHFKSLCISILEYGIIFYAKEEQIRNLVRVKNFQHVLEYYQKKPVILLCSHFVGLDFAAIRLSLDLAGVSVASNQKNLLITEKLKSARMRFMKTNGSKVFSRQDGLRQAIKELRRTKQSFYYLPDQDYGEKDSIYVPFFAFPTCATTDGLPRITKIIDGVVIPVRVFRRNNHYEVEIFKAWENYPTNNIESDVIFMNKFIENSIMQDISQYFWLHKRFKTQPGQERGIIYKDC